MKDVVELSRGEGRTRVILSARYLGEGLVVCIYNEKAHIGAVCLGEFDPESRRTSTSVITRRGHKDDAVAQKAAYLLTKRTGKPSCVVAGIHVEEITEAEIREIMENVAHLVEEFIAREPRNV